MSTISFLGAGSTIFAKNCLGDCLLSQKLAGSTYRLYDIDAGRLKDSELIIRNLAKRYDPSATIIAAADLDEALKDAAVVINAIQVGGYDPCTITDFEIPKKYGLRQTIGDTIGIGGIFRGLRTIPVVIQFLQQLEKINPNAVFLNYVNPMAIVTAALQKSSSIRVIGLCHSVQTMLPDLLSPLGMELDGVAADVFGINHMAWALSITKNGKDIYPEIKKRAFARNTPHNDMVRYEIMRRFGYYVTESSEHNAEYNPWFIKQAKPALIQEFNIPLDEYPRRCIEQERSRQQEISHLLQGEDIQHTRSKEYASWIIEALVSDTPYIFAGNTLNTGGLIENLPRDALVEVPCTAQKDRIVPCYMGALPTQCAALNQTNINMQVLTTEAALTQKRDTIYQAALMDPHTAAELSMDEIVNLCDDLIEAHGDWLPKFH